VSNPVVALDVRGGVAPWQFPIDEQTILGDDPRVVVEEKTTGR
jgi:hypothetical protein